jgi:NAD(P)H-dependent flavin oxidoreductase YrpB (nitropropane dioxygenase family)
VPRALNTEFIRKYKDGESARRDAEKVRQEIIPLLAKSTKAIDILVPFTGQSAWRIREVHPAAAIVKRTVSEARAILDKAEWIGKYTR